METLECTYSKSIFQKSADNTTIALYQGPSKCIIVTGEMLPTTNKIRYIIKGEWVNHPKYGRQFKMTDGYDIKKPSTSESIEEFLGSGSIKGIGKKTAKKIVEKYGSETFDVFDNDINRLLEISGITNKKIATIKESYDAAFKGRDIIVKLGKYGVSVKMASKIYQLFKEETLNILETAPYKFCSIKGITFPVADAMASNSKEYELCYDRFKACAYYVLSENEMNGLKDIIGERCSGSISMDIQDFGNAMLRLLRKDWMKGEDVLEYTCRMLKEGLLKVTSKNDCKYICKAGLYRIESELAGHISRFVRKENTGYDLDIYISMAEIKFNITLSEEQKQAVKNAFLNNLSLIIGGAGTGKTTIVTIIIYIYKEIFGNKELTFLAPTGKAAHRITETTGYPAFTIHKRLSLQAEQIHDVNAEEEILINDGLVFVDEMSMVDVRVAYLLFSSMSDKCKIILSGDDEQLQSVGAGAVLRDLIDASNIPKTVLHNVYRQKVGSNIFLNSDSIRHGSTELNFGEDFQLLQMESMQSVEDVMVETYIEKIKEYGIDNVMMLAPFKERAAGVNNLNSRVQDILLHDCKEEYRGNGKLFRVGDIVMQLKNNDTQINGDTGTVKNIDNTHGEKTITVAFDGYERVYSEEDVDELTLAYAYTVHKAQGSEAKCVIMCIHSIHSIMLKRNIAYTAISRGKKEVIIIGQKEALYKSIQTADKRKRNTNLKEFLEMYWL